MKTFTFYCSSIKGLTHYAYDCKTVLFTFYCSSIKGSHSLHTGILLVRHLHSTVVLLKALRLQSIISGCEIYILL